MSLPAERQQAMRTTLGSIDDPQERLSVALGWKHSMGLLLPEERLDVNRVAGCVSRVWLVSAMDSGRCRFRIDAESPLVRGLVMLMCGIYDSATPAEIIAEEPWILDELGLFQNLSPTRQNGLAAVRQTLVRFALAALP